MPLLQIHYSDNLSRDVSVDKLVDTMHAAALATGEVAPAALRTMAIALSTYAIADKDPSNAFVHVIVRVRKRGIEVMRRLGDELFAALSEFMEEQYQQRPLSLSLEFVEIDAWRRNNMHKDQAMGNERS